MKQLNNMSKEKAQRILFITVLILVFSVFFISLSLLDPKETPPEENPNDNPPNEEVPTYETVIAPYTAAEVEIIRKFWRLDQEEEDQLMSILQNGSTYSNSRGVSYSKDNQEFEVVACLSGTVKDITDDTIYGTIVLIEHDNGIESEYLSLSSVEVKEGDEVTQGDVIGKTGESDYDQSSKNHLHFRVRLENKYVNPEAFIGKSVKDIIG